MHRWAWLVFVAGCPGGDPCDPEDVDVPTLELGKGAGSAFIPFEEGEEVGLAVAPQGGFGIPVRARSEGLLTGVPLELTLEAWVDGTLEGTFTTDVMTLYCVEGRGLMWGAVVGFDPDAYPSNDDLLALDGAEVVMVVTATDADGRTATGEATVTLVVGN